MQNKFDSTKTFQINDSLSWQPCLHGGAIPGYLVYASREVLGTFQHAFSINDIEMLVTDIQKAIVQHNDAIIDNDAKQNKKRGRNDSF